MNILEQPERVIGSFESTTPSGETWKTTLYDLHNWSSGHVMVRQEGEGQTHDQVYSREDSKALAALLLEFYIKG